MPPEDLVEMTHLHEPAIVHALRARYRKNIIYTNTGAIVLALNPFKHLDHLYTRDMMELYSSDFDDDDGASDRRVKGEKKGGAETQPSPHVYAVAERAYSSMLRSFKKRDNDDGMTANGELPLCNQSILVSGESGAGKTFAPSKARAGSPIVSLESERQGDRESFILWIGFQSSTCLLGVGKIGVDGMGAMLGLLHLLPLPHIASLASTGNARSSHLFLLQSQLVVPFPFWQSCLP